MCESENGSQDPGNQRDDKIDPFVFDQGAHVSLFQRQNVKIILYPFYGFTDDPSLLAGLLSEVSRIAPTAFLPIPQSFESQPPHPRLKLRSSCGRIPHPLRRRRSQGRVRRLLRLGSVHRPQTKSFSMGGNRGRSRTLLAEG